MVETDQVKTHLAGRTDAPGRHLAINTHAARGLRGLWRAVHHRPLAFSLPTTGARYVDDRRLFVDDPAQLSSAAVILTLCSLAAAMAPPCRGRP
jgi:hypothetical protein